MNGKHWSVTRTEADDAAMSSGPPKNQRKKREIGTNTTDTGTRARSAVPVATGNIARHSTNILATEYIVCVMMDIETFIGVLVVSFAEVW